MRILGTGSISGATIESELPSPKIEDQNRVETLVRLSHMLAIDSHLEEAVLFVSVCLPSSLDGVCRKCAGPSQNF